MNGLFKFLNHSPEFEHRASKRCFPEKMFGVSLEAPQQFRLDNTLVNLDGYMWKQPRQQYHSVVGHDHSSSTFSKEHKKRLADDLSCFRRRKGLLSQFLDKHAWKKNVMPLLGAERSSQGRSLRNAQLSKIKSQNQTKRSSRQSINLHYSLRRDEKSSLERYVSQVSPLVSHTEKIGRIEAFETHFAKTPLPYKSRSIWYNPALVEQRKAQTSFGMSEKSNPYSTHQDSQSTVQDERLVTRRKYTSNAPALNSRHSRRRGRVVQE